MNGLISLAAIVALLLGLGGLIALVDRRGVSVRWLGIAALLVVLNDAMLTRAWGLLPDLLPQSNWNWQGKAMALFATLLIAATPAFGWRRCGLTLVQRPGSLRAAVPVALAYCAAIAALALTAANDAVDRETLAYQLTAPGLEEEPFYRGIVLFALGAAFAGRVRVFGVEWGWGALLSCWLFGMAHAFGYSSDGWSFAPLAFALTALPSLVAVWVRLRTGSLLLPVLMHNAGNTLVLFV